MIDISQNIKPLNLRSSYIYLRFNKCSILKSMLLLVQFFLFSDWLKAVLVFF